MTDDLSDFLSSEEKVPAHIYHSTLKYIGVCQKPGPAILKFYFSNLAGALMTLAVCPQFGFGPMGGENGVLNYVMDFGPVWCGFFCASVFMTGGHLFSFFLLKEYEFKWVSNHKYLVSLPWISSLFFIGMIGKYYVPGDISHYDLTFHVSWFAAAITSSIVYLKIGRTAKRYALRY